MSFEIDPLTFTTIFGIVLVGCGYLLGKWKGEGDRESTVNNTIDYLIANGFVKADVDEETGDITLHPFPEEKKRRKRT
jgi:hypothetical protein